ncbi:hypothetical protein OESDEN_07563, partial [Oesophagostomum dentatum]
TNCWITTSPAATANHSSRSCPTATDHIKCPLRWNEHDHTVDAAATAAGSTANARPWTTHPNCCSSTTDLSKQRTCKTESGVVEHASICFVSSKISHLYTYFVTILVHFIDPFN